ncbi:hypothetical protein CLVI_16390 [Clostridium vincentii]|uniref:Uncharacterized protein n=2 Tax=Clostridium vincentii TaxID=52704 RepID=A0A2T0BF51_9CLOT|nr:hypothetical protein CLVI_16390 [Clostridium vincentii]
MKRFTVLSLIFLCLIFNVIGVKPVFAISNTFKEGIYNVSDFNPSKNEIYLFSNVSSTDKIYMIIMDENLNMQHSILLLPKSEKHITVPILPTYRVILIGKGEMYFYPQEP